tara:strand:- start:19 stop:246 length:228 start_codon:yes stop_codon:yes gene_type:complete
MTRDNKFRDKFRVHITEYKKEYKKEIQLNTADSRSKNAQKSRVSTLAHMSIKETYIACAVTTKRENKSASPTGHE